MSYGKSRYSNEPSVKEMALEVLVEPKNIRVDEPPYIPRNRVPQELEDYYSDICGLVALNLTEKHLLTPAHTFLFNLAADNRFRTKEFETLVSVATACIDSFMTKNTDSDIGEVMEMITADVVDGVAAKNAEANRDLGALIEDKEWAILDEALDTYKDLQDLSSRRDRDGSSRQPRGNGRSNSRTGYVVSSRGRTGATAPPPVQRGRYERQSNSGFVSANDAMGITEPARVERTGRATTSRAIPRGSVAVSEVAAVEPAVQVSSKLKWRTSSKQPYRPLVNISTTDEVLQQTQDGVIAVFKPKETIVEDYEAHTTYMGRNPASRNPHARRAIVQETLKEIEAEAITAERIIISGENQASVHCGIGGFTLRALFDCIAKLETDKRFAGATSSGGLICEPIITDVDGSSAQPTYDWLATSRDLEMLGQRVSMLMEGSHERFKLSSSQVRALDDKLTKAFNRLLQRQLSIDSEVLELGSYSNDIIQAISILGKHSALAPALAGLRKVENEFITNHTFVMTGELRKLAIDRCESIITPSELSVKEKETIEFVGDPVLAVQLGVNANELAIDIAVGQSCALVKAQHQHLATLAETLVDANNPFTGTRSRIVISTLDGYSFELDKGLLGERYYLITRRCKTMPL